MKLRSLLDNGPDAVCPYDSPYEECDSSAWHKVRFDREEVTDLVDREPEERQRAEPKEEEGDEVTSVGSGRCGHGVLAAAGSVIVPRWPDRPYHEVNAVA